jgi:hypothetical protein
MHSAYKNNNNSKTNITNQKINVNVIFKNEPSLEAKENFNKLFNEIISSKYT